MPPRKSKRAKIEIPQCPLILEQSQLGSESDLYASFSYYPTDPDCTVVVVIKCENDAKMKLCMLHRGESEWTSHEHIASDQFAGRISSVTLQERAFHFWDEYFERVVTFQYDTMTWVNFYIITIPPLAYWVQAEANGEIFSSKSFEMQQLKQLILGIDNHDLCSISICVATGNANYHGTSHEFLEEVSSDDEEKSNKPRRELKGVGFQPRFYQISEDQQRW
ncbi:hypothetical protein K1719_032538 [Acacia pycnantha]|nr:hypothetical protein K1719_039003 [Acacia pycnantha]KAI9085471.1 hypothetical protein K1719_032538 [Acacia pycnantha]